MTNYLKILLKPDSVTANVDLTRFDRILLHLRCLCHDHRYDWHLAGVRRELRQGQQKQPISPAAA